MKKWKIQVKGITLIALVVTIIVLLILAGIAISLTIGNNGLFSRAQNAANTWRKAEVNEQEEMSNFEGLYDNTVKDLGLDGEKPRETFTFTLKFQEWEGNSTYELTAYEGDTWYTWMKNVESGVLSDKGALGDGLLEGFLRDAEINSFIGCKLEGMVSGAEIYYIGNDNKEINCLFNDKINKDIEYVLWVA